MDKLQPLPSTAELRQPLVKRIVDAFIEKKINPLFYQFHIDESGSVYRTKTQGGVKCGCAVSAVVDNEPIINGMCEDFQKIIGFEVNVMSFTNGFDAMVDNYGAISSHEFGDEVRTETLKIYTEAS